MSDTAIGVDIGGSHVECGIVCDDRVIASDAAKVENASIAVVLPLAENLIRSLLEKTKIHPSAACGIAVGICAVVDASGSITATNGKYDDGIGLNVARWAEQRFGLRCAVENDARLAVLGEHYAGAAKGFNDVVLITLGTGIGGAVLLGGELLRSEGGRAGALAGHLGVDWRGRMCSCGNHGCAEAEASTSSLDPICRKWEGFAESALNSTVVPIDFRRLCEAVDDGDRVAGQVFDRCIGVWSALAVSLIHAYDPQAIVFGGGVMQRHQAILPKIREHVARHAWLGKHPVAIFPTALGPHAALLGAIPLLKGRA